MGCALIVHGFHAGQWSGPNFLNAAHASLAKPPAPRHPRPMELLGHNKGPALDGRTSWRRHCWTRARKDLLGAKVPLEIVRIRIKRAKALGLSYPQYASVLMGGGRDITGFLFTINGLQLKLARRLELPDYVTEKLQDVQGCTLMSFAPSGEEPGLFATELSDVADLTFKSGACEPSAQGAWSQKRIAVQAVLKQVKLPAKSVVMIGDARLERDWSVAGKLAKFLTHNEYFLNSCDDRTGA